MPQPEPRPDDEQKAAATAPARRPPHLSPADAEQLPPGSEAEARERNKVIAGKRGWLFLDNDANDVIGQHTGRVKLSDQQLESGPS